MGAAPSASLVLRPWQRFHVRLTALYGLVVLGVLLVLSVLFHQYAVGRELAGIRQRLVGTAVAIASGIDAETVARLHEPAAQGSPLQDGILARMRAVAAVDTDISDLYVFRPTAQPGVLACVADHVIRANAKPCEIGETYTPAATIHMLDGLERPTVETEPYTDQWGTVLSGYAPVRDASGKAVALVGVDIQVARIDEIKARVRMLALLLFLGATLALVVLAKLVGISVREPLYKIVEASTAITTGAPTARLALDRKDEFGMVGRHFDIMASGLEERDFIKQTFGTYVSPQVVRKLLAERRDAVHGEERKVTVLFSDLRRFTTITESLSAQEVVAMLNDYLERMSQAVIANGGRIDKFIGDALMADWGAIEDVPDAEQRALQAALDMQAALDKLNVERAARNEVALAMGIGVHAGDVIAGSIGSQRKLEFTVIGDAVNTASRLEGLCKQYGAMTIASHAVVAAVANPPAHRRLDRVIVAGKAEPVVVVEVLAPDDPRVTRIATYERGMDALYAHDYAAATAAFEEAGAGLHDPVIEFQLERSRRLTTAPAGSWDGIERRGK